MAHVSVTINGRQYRMACEDGQENHLIWLSGDLDRRSAEEVLALLRTLNETLGKTVLMVTHDPHAAEAARVRRRLDKGQLT